MTPLPKQVNTVAELDELLSRPSPALVELMRRLQGDLLVLGAGGKIGPSLCRMAYRAIEAAGVAKQVIAVARSPLPELAREGITTLTCDLLDPEAVARLPRAANVVFMAGRKFGSTGNEPLTWAANVIVPCHVARVFTGSRVAVFSTGCVYPLLPAESGGATEQTPPEPVGEYAQSCLGRERVFDYYSQAVGERVVQVRLNYAIDLRYGVLHDLASRVWAGEPVDVTTAWVNVIWQGDACDWALRALELAASPSRTLNVTGPQMLSVRELAGELGRRLGREVTFAGRENGLAYLSDARQAVKLFGPAAVPLARMLAWTAHWLRMGGPSLGKPTHFETQDGRF